MLEWEERRGVRWMWKGVDEGGEEDGEGRGGEEDGDGRGGGGEGQGSRAPVDRAHMMLRGLKSTTGTDLPTCKNRIPRFLVSIGSQANNWHFFT